MPEETTTRAEIVAAADNLFYRQGYAHTSFADIAAVVEISRGNFYHHFKSKDEILDAVIEARLAKTARMLERWERAAEGPAESIRSFINILVANRGDIKRYGCPVGTLTAELAKLDHPSQPDAGRLFGLFRAWLAKHFAALGRKADADALALHLLARSQGVASLANAFHDEAFIRREVRLMEEWLEQEIS
ncbi:TetR/AcrR family transcriptional regulator [Dongia sp.]|uniref:TetR/AcrR family transcriptional regulator n=1 Tax=Dongia sp. TaxID=1977262 RepID=UPI00375046F3